MMVFQFYLVPKCFVAVGYRTRKRPLGLVNGLYVFVETSFLPEFLVAIGAHLRHNVAMKP